MSGRPHGRDAGNPIAPDGRGFASCHADRAAHRSPFGPARAANARGVRAAPVAAALRADQALPAALVWCARPAAARQLVLPQPALPSAGPLSPFEVFFATAWSALRRFP